MSSIQVAKKSHVTFESYNKKMTPTKILLYIVLSLWGLTTIFPLLWVFNNAFKSSSEIVQNSMAFPSSFNLDNLNSVNNYGFNLFKGFFNSFVMSGSVVFFVVLLGAMASFVLSRFRFKLTKPVKSFFIASMLVPVFAVLIPDMIILQALGLNKSSAVGYLMVIIPQVAGNINFAILMMTGFMATLPVELEEAAIIDGCSIGKIFTKIIVPLCKPVFATVGIMVFLWSYNDLLLPYTLLPTNKLWGVTVIISMVANQFGIDYGAMMMALVLTISPVILLYIFSQEYVVKGLTAGAVKG